MSYRRLTFHDRQIIERSLRVGKCQSEIARAIGVHRSTVSNEVKRNRIGKFYSAYEAHRFAEARTKRDFSAVRHKRLKRQDAQPACYFSIRMKESFLSDLRSGRLRKHSDNRKRKFKYEWTSSFKAEIFRQWYLNRRNRDHIREGAERTHRSLQDWKRYRKTNWAVIRKKLLTAFYKRSYVHSHFGTVKGLYRSRGWWSERGLEKESKKYLHIRYRYSDAPVPDSGYSVSETEYCETDSNSLSERVGAVKALRICLPYFCSASAQTGFRIQNFPIGKSFADYSIQNLSAVFNLLIYPLLFTIKKSQIIF